MIIKTPLNPDFDFYNCKKLYKKYQKQINDDSSFNEIIKNTLFFSFYKTRNLIGCIYLYPKSNHLFLNAFAKPKNHLFNIKALKYILNLVNIDIYAYSEQKPAILVLLRCGFKKIEKNTFVYHNPKTRKE